MIHTVRYWVSQDEVAPCRLLPSGNARSINFAPRSPHPAVRTLHPAPRPRVFGTPHVFFCFSVAI